MKMGTVQLTGVFKSFDNVEVLKNVSLEIAAGSVVVIVGPSGSGKSTLLRSLNGLEQISAGSIKLQGRTAMVFQSFHLFPHLTVLQNVSLAPIKVLKINEKEANRKSLELLNKVHIAEQANKYPNQLSGGQQQRVAIARALAIEPAILLFDEPTSALDPEMVGEVLEVMKDLARSGTTMICVTHEMAFAREFANRIVFLDKGVIEEDCTAEDFFEKSKSKRVAEFLGRIGV